MHTEDPATEAALAGPVSQALRVVGALWPACIIGVAVALAVPATSLEQPDGALSFALTLVTTSVFWLFVSIFPMLAWVAALSWVEARRGARVRALLAVLTLIAPMSFIVGTAVVAGDRGLLIGALISGALMAIVAAQAAPTTELDHPPTG